MARRIRLNQGYRTKVKNRIRQHLEQEPTQEKIEYDELKSNQIDINDNAWKVAENIVRRHYTEDDVEKAYYLQKIVVSIFIISATWKVQIMTTIQSSSKRQSKNILIFD